MQGERPIRLTDFLREENIICNLSVSGRDEAIAQLVSLLYRNEGGFNEKEVVETVLERERIGATTIAPGVALPHARLERLEKPLVAIGTSDQGIEFFAPNKQLSNLIILILTPKSDPEAYLRLVAVLSKCLREPDLKRKLAITSSTKDVFKILTEQADGFPTYLRVSEVMDPDPFTLTEADDLATAIDGFCRNRIECIPIVDEEKDLRGVILIEDLLRLTLPEHLLWMEDLSSIMRFEPFAELLRKERETKVADFMSETFESVSPDTPAIQLAKMFITHGVRQIQVLDGKRLVGVIDLERFMSQLFWT